jgi:hypothetical protein
LLVDFAFENYPKAGRDWDEIRLRIGRFLSGVWRIGLDGERAALAKQALPLNWSNGSVLRVLPTVLPRPVTTSLHTADASV